MKRRSIVLVAATASLAACAMQSPRDAAFVPEGGAQAFMPGIVSTPYAQVRAATSPDGAIAVRGSTNRPSGIGGGDIGQVAFDPASALFGVPANLFAGVNSAGDDFDAAFVDSGRVRVLARSDDVEIAPLALWAALRERTRTPHPRRLDARVNAGGGATLGPADDRAHPGILSFSGMREGGPGRADIHAIHHRAH